MRSESEKFLTDLKLKSKDEIIANFDRDDEEQFQDIFFFKRTLRYIHEGLGHIEAEKLRNYVLDSISFLYINIPLDKAIKTFTMMNGSKAKMLDEELIKAELLRQVSLPLTKNQEDSWEINSIRSKYAREWDKWLHWWRKKDVRKLFKSGDKQLGWLLEYSLRSENFKEINFDDFKILLKDSRSTKLYFKKLRRLQKSFEDIFNNPKTFNWLGLSLAWESNKDEQYKIIRYFINNKHDEDKLDTFAKWRVVGATHNEITAEHKDSQDPEEPDNKTKKAMDSLEFISQKKVYNNEGDYVSRKYLLYLNILEDNKAGEFGRKFNFSIFDNQSLEHIHPKSKAFHKKGDLFFDGSDKELETMPSDSEWLNRDLCPADVSEHSIGNLVLLEGRNNSTFGNKTFAEKKSKYFDLNVKFESRELLHTISVFANEKWGIDEITENQNKIINSFKKAYNI